MLSSGKIFTHQKLQNGAREVVEPMTSAEWDEYCTVLRRSTLRWAEKDASEALNKFPALPNGLTPDHVKASIEYKGAKIRYARAFAALRAFNKSHPPKRISQELRMLAKREGAEV
jgi:hypothetical protein